MKKIHVEDKKRLGKKEKYEVQRKKEKRSEWKGNKVSAKVKV